VALNIASLFSFSKIIGMNNTDKGYGGARKNGLVVVEPKSEISSKKNYESEKLKKYESRITSTDLQWRR
jgi:hypothetical protein